MGKTARSSFDLNKRLFEQIRFLERSAAAYDEGDTSEARRMSTQIRVLVHDTKRSSSLLGQLGLKTIAFVDGGRVPDPRNIATTPSLTGLEIENNKGRWIPRFKSSGLPPRLAPFDIWWNRPVLVDDQRGEFSRSDLVLAVADMDGGAHVDPALTETYARLSRQNSIGWWNHSPGVDAPIEGVELASLRQITWELLLSLNLRRSPAPAKLSPIGMNEQCYCRSGKKFKKCHGRVT